MRGFTVMLCIMFDTYKFAVGCTSDSDEFKRLSNWLLNLFKHKMALSPCPNTFIDLSPYRWILLSHSLIKLGILGTLIKKFCQRNYHSGEN